MNSYITEWAHSLENGNVRVAATQPELVLIVSNNVTSLLFCVDYNEISPDNSIVYSTYTNQTYQTNDITTPSEAMKRIENVRDVMMDVEFKGYISYEDVKAIIIGWIDTLMKCPFAYIGEKVFSFEDRQVIISSPNVKKDENRTNTTIEISAFKNSDPNGKWTYDLTVPDKITHGSSAIFVSALVYDHVYNE